MSLTAKLVDLISRIGHICCHLIDHRESINRCIQIDVLHQLDLAVLSDKRLQEILQCTRIVATELQPTERQPEPLVIRIVLDDNADIHVEVLQHTKGLRDVLAANLHGDVMFIRRPHVFDDRHTIPVEL